MKKSVIMTVLVGAAFLGSCSGGEEEGKKDGACKTGNGIEIDCKDGENFKKIGELNKKFELTFPETKEEYEAFIATNEPILKEIEPLWSSMENIVKADPGIAKQQHYTRTMDYKADVEKYKSILANLDKVTISGTIEAGKAMINVKNGTDKALKEIRGMMKYLDADGNPVCEKEYEIKASDLEQANGIPAGYDGMTDKGIYCRDANKVQSIVFEIQGMDYFEAAE